MSVELNLEDIDDQEDQLYVLYKIIFEKRYGTNEILKANPDATKKEDTPLGKIQALEVVKLCGIKTDEIEKKLSDLKDKIKRTKLIKQKLDTYKKAYLAMMYVLVGGKNIIEKDTINLENLSFSEPLKNLLKTALQQQQEELQRRREAMGEETSQKSDLGQKEVVNLKKELENLLKRKIGTNIKNKLKKKKKVETTPSAMQPSQQPRKPVSKGKGSLLQEIERFKFKKKNPKEAAKERVLLKVKKTIEKYPNLSKEINAIKKEVEQLDINDKEYDENLKKLDERIFYIQRHGKVEPGTSKKPMNIGEMLQSQFAKFKPQVEEDDDDTWDEDEEDEWGKTPEEMAQEKLLLEQQKAAAEEEQKKKLAKEQEGKEKKLQQQKAAEKARKKKIAEAKKKEELKKKAALKKEEDLKKKAAEEKKKQHEKIYEKLILEKNKIEKELQNILATNDPAAKAYELTVDNPLLEKIEKLQASLETIKEHSGYQKLKTELDQLLTDIEAVPDKLLAQAKQELAPLETEPEIEKEQFAEEEKVEAKQIEQPAQKEPTAKKPLEDVEQLEKPSTITAAEKQLTQTKKMLYALPEQKQESLALQDAKEFFQRLENEKNIKQISPTYKIELKNKFEAVVEEIEKEIDSLENKLSTKIYLEIDFNQLSDKKQDNLRERFDNTIKKIKKEFEKKKKIIEKITEKTSWSTILKKIKEFLKDVTVRPWIKGKLKLSKTKLTILKDGIFTNEFIDYAIKKVAEEKKLEQKTKK